jgi:alkylation response protein AidB-like acyl-CoA dehydrogenase
VPGKMVRMHRKHYAPEHITFAEAVRAFIDKEMVPNFLEWEQSGTVPRELFQVAGRHGFLGMAVPEEYGGGGVSDFRFNQALNEQMALAGVTGAGLGITLHNDTCLPYFLTYATDQQRRRWLPGISSGELITAVAMTEPGAGSDLAALAATAVRDGDEWVLNGEKWFVTSEGDPGVYLVAAVADGEQLLFIVDPGTPGLEIKRVPRFLHDPYIDLHPEITLRDCRIPTANLVAGGDTGSREWILVERLFIAARCCGAAERLLGEATAWAQEREAFGGPIFENQGVAFPLADSLTELHAARLLTYHAAHAFDTLSDRKVVHGKVAMAKLYASEMAGRVADRAVQIFGGRGYSHDTAAARFYRELRVDRIWEGTSEIQRLIIARGLAKRGAAPYLGWE